MAAMTAHKPPWSSITCKCQSFSLHFRPNPMAQQQRNGTAEVCQLLQEPSCICYCRDGMRQIWIKDGLVCAAGHT